jgi:hypothetical protein
MSAGPPQARGPITSNPSNRPKAGPECILIQKKIRDYLSNCQDLQGF